MITKVLSHERLITLFKLGCVYSKGQGMINMRPPSLEILSNLTSTLVLNHVSAFGQLCGPCLHTDTCPVRLILVLITNVPPPRLVSYV